MTIYFDVSTSYEWRRNPVGIVRVEREYATHLRKHVQGLRFCRVDRERATHVLLSDPEVDALLGKEWCKPVERAEAAAPQMSVLARKAKAAARRLMPAILSRGVVQVVPSNSPAAAYRPLPELGQADVFMSVGADWDHLPVEYVRAMKRESGCKVVLACYDTIVVDFPEYAISSEFRGRLREHLLGLAANADLVVAISDSTKEDLLRFWRKESVRAVGEVIAVPLASATPIAVTVNLPTSDRLDALKSQGPYVVYVSTLEARKNHRLLFNLWREFHAEQEQAVPRLVLVGARGWGVNDLLRELECSEAGRDGYIQVWSDVDDELLHGLYANCEFGVFPSFYEGWGLAATELLAHGKTCVVSRSSSLQEATQDVCPSFHPCDHLGWRDEIRRLSHNLEYRRQREADIAARFRPRSWADCSRELASRLFDLSDASDQQVRARR